MKFQNFELPLPANKIGETSLLTETTVLKGLLNKHMSPKGKVGLVLVTEGSLEFVWEDDLENVLSSDKDHPIVIEPERYHHVIITGKVVFKVAFYKDVPTSSIDEQASRPGEAFISNNNNAIKTMIIHS